MRRSFLFLQGVCSPFFARLADRLVTLGHRVHRINFNGGDAAYWWPRKAWHYRGDVETLREYLDDKYRRFGITDQVLFGDRRPIHRPAVAHAEACGVRTHVFEEGYFRPHWITLEREGVNGHSLLPRDPDWFRETGKDLVERRTVVPFVSPFRTRALHDVVYHLACAANPVLFPGYRPHGIFAPLEYLGYLHRFARLRCIRRREQRRVQALIEARVPYYFLPLQLNVDAQIRDHSRFEHMGEVIEYVLASFAGGSPPGTKIVIKNHPLDMGLMNYERIIRHCARRFDLEGRVVYLEAGDLNALVQHALGVVTVNSTVGIAALQLGRPTLTLSDPIYNLRGLTSQASLNGFWQSPEPPDGELFDRFQRVVVYATQLNGGFYCSKGIALATESSARVLSAEVSPLESLLGKGGVR